MEHLQLSVSRSASLPICSDTLRTAPTLQASSPRETEVIVNAPMTPPMSPRQSEEGDDIRATPSASEGEYARESVDMQVESTQSATPPRLPVRLLEDEQVHVERSGILKLTDFEVKGTLGAQIIITLSHCRRLTPFQALAPLVAYSLCAFDRLRSLALKTTLL